MIGTGKAKISPKPLMADRVPERSDEHVVLEKLDEVLKADPWAFFDAAENRKVLESDDQTVHRPVEKNGEPDGHRREEQIELPVPAHILPQIMQAFLKILFHDLAAPLATLSDRPVVASKTWMRVVSMPSWVTLLKA